MFTRSVGMRLAIVGTAHLQARGLDHGLDLGNRSVDILARVQSSRAKDYVREFTDALAPWSREPAVRGFLHHARTERGVTPRPGGFRRPAEPHSARGGSGGRRCCSYCAR
ncbi:hypothetical protein GCM10010300_80670 [Streptomyces olivaceoviridis]|nr:hypothetical protein GCM10010300_80670 [Streptomyces olivaceoviridis]